MHRIVSSLRRAVLPAVAAIAVLAAVPGPVGESGALIGRAYAQDKIKRSAPKGPTITPDEATNFIREMGNRTVSVLSQQGDAKARNAAFTAIMLEAMDFEAMALQTLGKMARTVSQNDKKEFTQLFAAYVIDVAIERFGSTKVNSFAIGQLKPQPNGDIKVNTAVTADKPLNVDWRLHNKAGKPSINDVEVDGYSLVIHYRGEFERAGVSNVPGLIGKLKSLTSNSTALPVVRTAMK
ncbi:MAG: ABC transporter substrate-binding protein [Alphaproteobacteria bacterium]|nr:ABC transporter substrate-binding protein [Alphaproteobacteria bacterium]